jgi:hypothetical protein
VLPFFDLEAICSTVGSQYGSTGFLIDPMSSINSMNPKSYIRRIIFYLNYVNITTKLQNERHTYVS